MATAQRPAAPAAATLRVERRFAAPPERLFAAWSSAEGLSHWAAPGEMRPTAEVDLRVGGRYRISMEGPDGAVHVVGGAYREIDPPRRLVYTWQWERKEGFPETLVTVEFRRRADGGTDLVLVHEGLPDADSYARHAHGWDGCLDKLAAEAAPR